MLIKNMLFALLIMCGMNFSMHAMQSEPQTNDPRVDLIRQQHQANIDLNACDKYFRSSVLILGAASLGCPIVHLMKGNHLSDQDAIVALLFIFASGVLSSFLWGRIDYKQTERDNKNEALRNKLTEIMTVKQGAAS